MVTPPALSMQSDIIGLAQLVERISLFTRQTRPSNKQVESANFGPVSDVVETVFSGVELPQTNQAMRISNISAKGRLDTMLAKNM